MLSYTGCRPAKLVDATKTSATSSDSTSYNENPNGDYTMSGVAGVLGCCKALRYEDISLMVVRNPEGGELDVLAMEVRWLTTREPTDDRNRKAV